MKDIEIQTLIENRVSKTGLVAEHGLSFFIKHPDANILFDTGQTSGFAENAKVLGINIASIDFLIISHGHNDHTGGLSHFIENNEKAIIILKDEALWPKFKNDKSIGLNKHFNVNNSRFRKIREITELVKGVYIVPQTETFFSVDKHMSEFYTEDVGGIKPDRFNDEIFIAIKNEYGISILSSCSHNGITNMAETAQNHFVVPLINIIGGFHIKNAADSIVDHISEYFNKNKVANVYTCHCTGIEKFSQLKIKCDSMVSYIETGGVIKL